MQTAAFLQIATKRRQRELRELLAIIAIGAQGNEKSIQKALKDDQ